MDGSISESSNNNVIMIIVLVIIVVGIVILLVMLWNYAQPVTQTTDDNSDDDPEMPPLETIRDDVPSLSSENISNNLDSNIPQDVKMESNNIVDNNFNNLCSDLQGYDGQEKNIEWSALSAEENSTPDSESIIFDSQKSSRNESSLELSASSNISSPRLYSNSSKSQNNGSSVDSKSRNKFEKETQDCSKNLSDETLNCSDKCSKSRDDASSYLLTNSSKSSPSHLTSNIHTSKLAPLESSNRVLTNSSKNSPSHFTSDKNKSKLAPLELSNRVLTDSHQTSPINFSEKILSNQNNSDTLNATSDPLHPNQSTSSSTYEKETSKEVETEIFKEITKEETTKDTEISKEITKETEITKEETTKEAEISKENTKEEKTTKEAEISKENTKEEEITKEAEISKEIAKEEEITKEVENSKEMKNDIKNPIKYPILIDNTIIKTKDNWRSEEGVTVGEASVSSASLLNVSDKKSISNEKSRSLNRILPNMNNNNNQKLPVANIKPVVQILPPQDASISRVKAIPQLPSRTPYPQSRSLKEIPIQHKIAPKLNINEQKPKLSVISYTSNDANSIDDTSGYSIDDSSKDTGSFSSNFSDPTVVSPRR